MWPILPALHKSAGPLFCAALLVAASFAFAQEAVLPADSNAVVSADSLLQQMTPMVAEPDRAQDAVDSIAPPAALLQNDSIAAQPLPDSSRNCVTVDLTTGEIEPDAVNTPSQHEEVSGPKKSVLYLSGGERSPWFHLGVLYAIETYKVRIDSVVGTSWGAFVGYLWTHGMTLDDIQRILLDPYLQGYVGHNMFDDLYNKKSEQAKWPISPDGLPGLRYRYALEPDLSGNLQKKSKPIEPDTSAQRYALAKLRLQEAMNRVPHGAVIPFTVLGCNGMEWKTAEYVFKSLPLVENYNALPDSVESIGINPFFLPWNAM